MSDTHKFAQTTLTIRPCRETYKKALATAPVLLGGAAVGFARHPVVLLGIVAIMIPVGLLVALLYFRSAGIDIGQAELRRTTITGRHRTHQVGDIGEIVFVPALSSGDGRFFPNLFVFDRWGRRMLRMRGMSWAVEDMQRLMAAIDRNAIVYELPTRAKELKRRHPTSVNRWEARPILFGVLLTIVSIIAMVSVIALLE